MLFKTAAAVDAMAPKYALMRLIAPVPDLMKAERVVFIGPHPDDIEVGCGATLHKMVKAGKAVKMVVCTDGGSGRLDAVMTSEEITATRKAESEAAAKLLGAAEFVNLGFPDGGPYDEDKLAAAIAWEIYTFAPDLVICPDPTLPSETHPDHLKCARAAVTAVTISGNFYSGQRHGLTFEPEKIKFSKTLAYYYTHRANSFVKLAEEDLDGRAAALALHKSQFEGLMLDGLLVYLGLRAKDMGSRAGTKYAEGFFAMAPMHQHASTEINHAEFYKIKAQQAFEEGQNEPIK